MAIRAAATAESTCSHVWTRPMRRSMASSAACTPSEMRLKPALRKARSAFQSPALSGLASSVISASGAT